MNTIDTLSKLNSLSEVITLSSGYAYFGVAVASVVMSVAYRTLFLFPIATPIFYLHAGSAALGFAVSTLHKCLVEHKTWARFNFIEKITCVGAVLGIVAVTACLVSQIGPAVLSKLCLTLYSDALTLIAIPSLLYTIYDLTFTLSGNWKHSDLYLLVCPTSP